MARPRKDYTGIKFGTKTLIRYLPERSHGTYIYQCDCGRQGTAQLSSLKQGKCISCSSCAMKKRYENIEDIVGKTINEWFVISERDEKTPTKNKLYNVKCSCGNESIKTKAQIKKRRYCLKCSQKQVARNKESKYTEKYLGTIIGNWKIIDRIHENGLFKFIGICSCGTIKKSDSIASFKKSTGCHKCCVKNNQNGLKEFFIKSAKKLEGTSNLYFKIIKVIGCEKGNIRFQCKCLSCGKKLILTTNQINSNISCGCVRKERLPRGSDHHNAKLTEVEASSIKELFKSGYYTREELAIQFNISKTQIGYIIRGESWNHI